jgi:hypothetical protein
VEPRNDAVIAAPQERTHEQLVVGVHAELAIGEEELDPAYALFCERRERGLVERVRLVHRGERLDSAGRARCEGAPACARILHPLARRGRGVGLDRSRARAQRGSRRVAQALVHVRVRVEAAGQHVAAARV